MLILATIIGLIMPGLAQRTSANDAPPAPSPAEILDGIIQRTAATRLLAEMGPDTAIDTKVGRLIDRLVLRDHDQAQAAVTALTMLGKPAVPAIIRRIDDRRAMSVHGIAFENRAVDRFEAVRQYGTLKVVDCLDYVLNDITGESFGNVGIVSFRDADRPEFDTQRSAIVAGWRGYLSRVRPTRRAPGKSLSPTSVFAACLSIGPFTQPPLAVHVQAAPEIRAAQTADPGKEDRERLRGTWSVTKVTEDGKEIEDRGLSGAKVTFGENELVWEGGEGKERHTFKLDIKSEPRAMFTTRVEPARQQSGWMIYAWNGDKLRIGFNDALIGRPVSFEPRKKLIVVELERASKRLTNHDRG
jgi:uncharacterized protein (TIGR03067 family)